MKMKHYVSIGILSMLFFSCEKERSDSSHKISFEKSYGGTMDDKGNSALIKGNALYVLGTTKSFNEPNGDFYLLKLDLEGNIIYEKTYGGSAPDYGIEIIESRDGNIVLVGSTESAGNGLQDIYAIKINEAGDVLWETTIGGAMNDKPASIIETSNGNFCIAGGSESYSNGGQDIYLCWLDQNGNLIREENYGGTSLDGSTEIMEIENNELMLYGYTKNFGATSRDFILLKLQSSGELIWQKRYGGDGYEESQDFARTANGDFVLSGHSSSIDPNHDLYALKVDANGNKIWDKHYGGAAHDGGQSMLINSDGNYVYIARSMSYGNGSRNVYMVCSNPNGDIISETVIGGDQNDWGNKILEHESYYYIVGHSNSFSGSHDDAYVVKYKK
jgi:hypothetical protein